MNDRMPIFVRAHTEILERPDFRKKPESGIRPKRPDPEPFPHLALVLDCETTTGLEQSLTFACFRACRNIQGRYETTKEGLIYSENLSPEERDVLAQYAKANALPLYSRSAFLRQVFWPCVQRGSLIDGFHLAFDLSRLAAQCSWTSRRGGGWSFVMDTYKNPKTGKIGPDKIYPRIVIRQKDSKGGFYRLTKSLNRDPFPPIRCVDVKTLLWALWTQSHSLRSAGEAFKIKEAKLDHTPSGLVTTEEVDYCRRDVAATLELLNLARTELERHPIHLLPERAYSPASVAKGYLAAMGIIQPLKKFDLSPEIHGIAMQAYHGGRAEARIRHEAVPCVLVDVMSEYPSANVLLGIWDMLVAKELKIEDATQEVCLLLEKAEPDDIYDQSLWKQLAFFALVQPSEDVFPVRTLYNPRTTNIGINRLTSNTPVWFAGPDVLAAKIHGGKSPKVLRAIKIVPVGQQEGLQRVRLRNMITIDPRTDDIYKAIIETRARVDSDDRIPEAEREALVYFLKILANSGSYGLFVELNPERVGKDPKTGKPARATVRVFSGEETYETTSEIVEIPGKWYCPVFGALITAGGRLFLTAIEDAIKACQGNHLFCDTDSAAIAASKDGGVAACVGGREQLPDGREAIKLETWEQIRAITEKLDRLNPYNKDIVRSPILKIEKINFGLDGEQIPIDGFVIAAKRYALCSRTVEGDIKIVKASGHGLGYLCAPRPGFDLKMKEHTWVIEGWQWILREAFGIPHTQPHWFSYPAMMQISLTSPEVLKRLQARQKRLPYREQVKPFGFVRSPILSEVGGCPGGSDPDQFTLIAPFTSDASQWYGLTYTNLYDGRSYRIKPPEERVENDIEVKTYGDVLAEYRWHPEAKSLAPDGDQCRGKTSGLLQRMSVIASGELCCIGKETRREWEREDNDTNPLNELPIIQYHRGKPCRILGCTRQRHAKGFCQTHLQAFYRGRIDARGNPSPIYCRRCKKSRCPA